MKSMIAGSMDSTIDEILTKEPPTESAVLVLNTKPFAAKPLVFDLNGELKNIESKQNILKFTKETLIWILILLMTP